MKTKKFNLIYCDPPWTESNCLLDTNTKDGKAKETKYE